MRSSIERVIDSLCISSHSDGITPDAIREIKAYAPVLYGTDSVTTDLFNHVLSLRRKKSQVRTSMMAFLCSYAAVYLPASFAYQLGWSPVPLDMILLILAKADLKPLKLYGLGFYSEILVHGLLITLAIYAPKKFFRLLARDVLIYARRLKNHLLLLQREGRLVFDISEGPIGYRLPVTKEGAKRRKHKAYRAIGAMYLDYDGSEVSRDEAEIIKTYAPSLYGTDPGLTQFVDRESVERNKRRSRVRLAHFFLAILILFYSSFCLLLPALKGLGLLSSFFEKHSSQLIILSLGIFGILTNSPWYWLLPFHLVLLLLFLLGSFYLIEAGRPSPYPLYSLLNKHLLFIFKSGRLEPGPIPASRRLSDASVFHSSLQISTLAGETSSSLLSSIKDTKGKKFDYEVALSFAGEERLFADNLAAALRSFGISVFYDQYERDSLWGKNLVAHLHDVYARRALYCVVLVSASYAQKVWTTHELRAAQEQALARKGEEYILPIRFDSTEIPGLPGAIGYLDYSIGVAEICNLLLKKLGRSEAGSPSKPKTKPRKRRVVRDPLGDVPGTGDTVKK